MSRSAVSSRDRFDDGHLSGESLSGGDPNDLVDEDYDYILMGTSWDERCLTLTRCTIKAARIQVFRPANRGSGELRARHDAAIGAWAHASTEHVDWVDQPSEELELGFSRIREGLLEARRELDRPLRVLVDLSATARYFTLAAVAIGLNEGVAEYVDVMYADGEYGDIISETESSIDNDAASTWETFAIPSLEGDWYPTRRRHFLISVGFSGDQAARITERADPDAVTVLMPMPGLRPEYEVLASKNNEPWMQRYGVDANQIVDAPPSDAIGTWRAIAEAAAVNPLTDNVFCLLTGTKPHALALSLWAMARTTPAVLYVRPSTHQEGIVRPAGRYWRYRLWDRSSLSGRFLGE